MIAILSQALGETSTSRVMDWLHHLGAPHLRVNGDELNEGLPFSAELAGNRVALEMDLGADGVLRGDEVGSVWFRRWHVYQNLDRWKTMDPCATGHAIHGFLAREVHALSGVVEAALPEARWLTRGDQRSVRKFHVLREAADIGLDVPDTLVTNTRARLAAFRERHGRVISKPLGESDFFLLGGRQYSTLTAEVTDAVMDALPEHFFPTLVQPLLPKSYELRVFHLAGRSWCMAIFSQRDPQTQLDFRHYNQDRPNRTVPFRLPREVEDGISALMRRLELDTGSLDFVRTTDGRYVFLEVNPVGQFGMVSDPCNYHLERRIAEHLIALENDHA